MAHAPRINTYFSDETATPSFVTSPTHAPVRSRKLLPFPLPDPYSQDNFEVHDPRGFFKKRRASSISNGSSEPLVQIRRDSRAENDGTTGNETDEVKGLNAGISGLSLALQSGSAAKLVSSSFVRVTSTQI
jgi:hypothetical protein